MAGLELDKVERALLRKMQAVRREGKDWQCPNSLDVRRTGKPSKKPCSKEKMQLKAGLMQWKHGDGQYLHLEY